jgi:hypothetical protein
VEPVKRRFYKYLLSMTCYELSLPLESFAWTRFRDKIPDNNESRTKRDYSIEKLCGIICADVAISSNYESIVSCTLLRANVY